MRKVLANLAFIDIGHGVMTVAKAADTLRTTEEEFRKYLATGRRHIYGPDGERWTLKPIWEDRVA